MQCNVIHRNQNLHLQYFVCTKWALELDPAERLKIFLLKTNRIFFAHPSEKRLRFNVKIGLG